MALEVMKLIFAVLDVSLVAVIYTTLFTRSTGSKKQ